MPLLPQEMDLFRSEFMGVIRPNNGIERPVYLGLRELKAGDTLYRGCMVETEARALEYLQQPCFFSH